MTPSLENTILLWGTLPELSALWHLFFDAEAANVISGVQSSFLREYYTTKKNGPSKFLIANMHI